MKSKRKLILLALILFSFQIKILHAQEVDQVSQVTNIVDGDTFDLNTGERIRFADIDAPEINDPGGQDAKQYLTSLILGKTVYLDIDDVYRTDYKGEGTRLVCLVFVIYSDTHRMNINEALVRASHAVYKEYENEFSPPWNLYFRYESDPPPTPSPPSPTPDPDPPSPPDPPPSPEYTLTIQLEGQGTINHPTGTTTYKDYTLITITATPKDYWKIENWILNGEPQTNQNTITFMITQDTQLEIQFSLFLPDCSTLFKITDEHGKPLENTSIESTKKPEYQSPISLATGADGEAEIAPLYHGNYVFKIEKEGHVSKTIEIWLDKDEARYEEISLEITKIELCIILTDSYGNPLVGVEVLSSTQPKNQEQVSGVTNYEGVVVFSEVLPGSYSFDVFGDYVDSQIEVESETSETSFDERITLFGELSGFVFDKDGNPLEEVEVFSVSEPSGQESLSCVCDGRYNFSRVLSGSYRFTFQKTGYMPVNRSIFLMEGQPGVIGAVTLFPRRQDYSPFITAGLLIGTVVVAFYLGSDKSFLVKVTTPDQRINEVSEPVMVVERVVPVHFDSDKSLIIKTICVEGFHSLTDIQKYSGLEDYLFWGAFYELLSDGEIEANDSRQYVVRDDIKKQWLEYLEIS